MSSGDLIADRRYEWARDSEAKGDLSAAADLLAQALELAPQFASAWFALGEVRLKLGNENGAAEAFERARAADPQDRHGAALYLARLRGGADAMPQGYVRALFDAYAPAFDETLTGPLNYRAPELLLAAVQKARIERMKFGAMLDLGCGTGLAGAAFRQYCDWLVGVDLSAAMLAKARGKGLYDKLFERDVMEFLGDEAADNGRYHLVVAADVFMFFDNLAPLIAAIAPCLEVGGVLAFSVETHNGDGVLLRETLRYAHGAAHVRRALEAAGLKLLGLDSAATRTEKGVPVPGLIGVAER
jgi:predicted TPR repeat methyltransferase